MMNIALIDHNFSPPGNPPTIVNKLADEIGNELQTEIKGFQSLNDNTIQELKQIETDVILLDVNFPDSSRLGIELIKVVKEKLSEVKTIMFTNSEVKFTAIRDALQLGAVGYIFKLNPIEDIANGISFVVKNNETFLCKRSKDIIYKNLLLKEPNTTELKLLAALSCDETMSNQKLGDIFNTVGQNIGYHLKRLYKKTGTNEIQFLISGTGFLKNFNMIIKKKFYSIVILLLLAFSNYSQVDLFDLTLNGEARNLDELCYELTPNELDRAGSIWSGNQIDLRQSFIIEAKLFLGCKYTNDDCPGNDDDGADGIVFGLQQLSTTIGGTGSNIGFGGISPSLGIEFDTYQNSGNSDPEEDHIAIIKNGIVNHVSTNNLAGPVQASADSKNVEDCGYHLIKIEWNHINKTIQVYFDCVLRLSKEVDLVQSIFNGESNMYWGFTSATGGCSNIHEVCFLVPPTFNKQNNIQMCLGDTIQLHNLNKPEGFTFSWSPTEFMVDATVFNPMVSPTSTINYTLNVTNACNETTSYNFGVDVNCDCRGNFNGTAVFDECGVCEEPLNYNQSCTDCNGVPNGTFEVDSCGVCLDPNNLAFNETCKDCFGNIFGTALIDSCGLCLESTDPTFNETCKDCNGVVLGTALVDSCGLCLEPDNSIYNATCKDCNGTFFGTALVDSCGLCLEADDPVFNETCKDCKGVIFGTALVDSCGICLESNSPEFNETCKDCMGDVFGTAIVNSCGLCLDSNDPKLNQTCRKDVYIPNAFSPNGDGVNDTFEIAIFGDVAGFNLMIYNRWGKKVFSSNQNNMGWEGKDQPMDVYVYGIEVNFSDNTSFTKTGNITLIR